MNTLSDLRSTLDEHAERVPDGEAVVRTAAVRHRVSVVRRRRRAVGAGGLSLALVLVGAASFVTAVTATPCRPHPRCSGCRRPTTMTSLGYTYRTDGTSETIAGAASVEVDGLAQPRLVSWTTDRPTTVRLELPDGEYWTSSASRFRDFVVIPPGPGGTLRVSAPEGRVGLATYDVTDAQPDGVTRDGVTFRRTVADTPLLAAAIGARGADGGAYLVRRGARPGPDERALHGAPAGSTVPRRHGGHGEHRQAATAPRSTRAAAASERPPSGTRAAPSRSASGSPARHVDPAAAGSDDVRIGVGLYGPVASEQVAGAAVEHAMEYGGHTWDLRRGRPVRTSPVRYTGGSRAVRSPRSAADGASGTTDLRFQRHGHADAADRLLRSRAPAATGPYWVPAGAAGEGHPFDPGSAREWACTAWRLTAVSGSRPATWSGRPGS